MATKVVVIYYSQTGTIHQLAQEYAVGAEKAGEKWKAHREETASVPEATADDILWADAGIFGSPTRYGYVAAQLKQFIDPNGTNGSLVTFFGDERAVRGFGAYAR